jgi:hypothetical protein
MAHPAARSILPDVNRAKRAEGGDSASLLVEGALSPDNWLSRKLTLMAENNGTPGGPLDSAGRESSEAS